jgi:signal transduction histidine kinase
MSLLSLRQTLRGKIAVGMGLFLALLLLMGSIARYDLGRIERAARLIDMVDDLRNDVLEMRRYEKNLQLFPGREGDLAALRHFVDTARARAAAILEAHTTALGHRPGDGTHRRLGLLQEGLEEYARLLAKPPHPLPEANLPALSALGTSLSGLADAVVRQVRQGIFKTVRNLRLQLLAAAGVLLALGVVFAWQLGRRVLLALGAIETAALEVGAGRPLPHPPARLEKEARHVLSTLEQMTAELENRHALLLQEKKLASLGVLTAGVAHQLNNPLNNISVGCALLREDLEDGRQGRRPPLTPDDAAAQLDAIGAEALRARDIVRGLLDFARDTPFAASPRPLAQVVEQALALVRHDLGPGVDVTAAVPQDLILPLDARHMQEALINLLLNAAQAMRGQGRIRITAKTDQTAAQAVLQVEDNGPGIPSEYLGRVFDPFFTLKPVGEGTGLGLSIAFGIVRRHHGRIDAANLPDGGARFTIRLPLHSPKDGAA